MPKRSYLALQMLEHMTHQRESGIAIGDYAAQIGITAHKLRYWIDIYINGMTHKNPRGWK